MKFSDVIKMCFKDLGRRKGRTFLTSLAVAIGSMLIVTMVGLGSTAENFILGQLKKNVQAKKISVAPQKYMDLSEVNQNMTQEEYAEFLEKNFKKIDEGTIKKFKDLQGVEEVKASVTNPISEIIIEGKSSENKRIRVEGYYNNESPFNKEEVDSIKKKNEDKKLDILNSGSLISDSKENGVLIGEKLLKKMGIKDYESLVGKDITIVQKETINPNMKMKPLEIKGKISGVINENFEDEYIDTIVVPFEMALKTKSYYELNNNYFNEKAFELATVYAKDTKDVEGISKSIKDIGYSYMSQEDIAKQVKKVLTVVQQILSVLGIIVLFVAALGTANTMTMAIHERTKTIGIMRATGANRGNIHNIFLTQAGVIGFIGGTMGLVFSFMNGKIIEIFLKGFLEKQGIKETISFSMPSWLVMGSLGFAIVISLISGIYPARKASKLDAIEALNS